MTPHTLTPDEAKRIRRMKNAGWREWDLMSEFKVSYEEFQRALSQQDAPVIRAHDYPELRVR
jgi:hypothetical protein